VWLRCPDHLAPSFGRNAVFQLIAFALASAVFVYVSRASLRRPRSHGFYRFFAFELLVVLLLLNVDVWFRAPLSAPQLISWILLCTAAVLVFWGVRLLRQRGKPSTQRADEPLLAFEKTTVLVTTGLYRYIRHPLYGSLLFLAWGIFFKDPSWLGAGLAAAVTLCLVATAKAEEAENIAYFGDAYRAYMRHTAMFIPFLF
jgi:protein-S-isoprenylcysteine O-methyltransferase Ste14